MIEVISTENSANWDEVVKSFSLFDVYYLSGYVKAFALHGDGNPLLYYYQKNDIRGICVMMKRDISLDIHFKNIIPDDTFFDITTPYGYGGFLFEGNTCTKNILEFNQTFSELLNSENIISLFGRFHPQLDNAKVLRQVTNVIDLGKTIEIDLESEDVVWNNISSKNRNVIRGAIRKGVVIKHDKRLELFDNFIDIYNRTMDKNEAHQYYYFDADFYKSIHDDFYDNFEMFYAEHEGRIIAMTIILYANNRMHYHLSCSEFEYRYLSPSNLLLYKAACWGVENGFETFHLGGGFNSGRDALYKFKEAFNRNSGLQFSIGKKIINQEKYDFLVEIRKKGSSEFNINSSFFPLYRS
jgi:hypothetical protein